MREPLVMPAETDLTGLFRMTCPGCGREARVQGNVSGIWIVQHEQSRGQDCPNSNRKIIRQPRPVQGRPAEGN